MLVFGSLRLGRKWKGQCTDVSWARGGVALHAILWCGAASWPGARSSCLIPFVLAALAPRAAFQVGGRLVRVFGCGTVLVAVDLAPL